MNEFENNVFLDLEEIKKQNIAKAFGAAKQPKGTPQLPGGLPEGTIKEWKGGKFIKQGGKWVPYTGGSKGKQPEEIKGEKGKKPEEIKGEKGKGKNEEVEGFSVGEMVELTPKYGITGVKMGTIKGFTLSKDKQQMAIVENSAGKKVTVPIKGLIDRKPNKKGDTSKVGGGTKTPQDHAQHTSTEDLKKYIEKPDADPNLKKIAEAELKNRMGGESHQTKEEGKKDGDGYKFDENKSTSENIKEEAKFNREKQQKHVDYAKKTLDNLPHMGRDKKQFMTDEILNNMGKITDKASADAVILNGLKKWDKNQGEDIKDASQIEGAHPKAVERFVKEVFSPPNANENGDQYTIRTFDLGVPGMMMEDTDGMRYKFLGNDKDNKPMYVDINGDFYAEGTKGYDKIKAIQDAYKDNVYLPKNSAQEVYDSLDEQLMDPDVLSDYYSIEDGMIWDRMESNYIESGDSIKDAIGFLLSQDFVGSVDYGYDVYSQLNVTRERTDWDLGEWIDKNHPKLMAQMKKSFKKWMKEANKDY